MIPINPRRASGCLVVLSLFCLASRGQGQETQLDLHGSLAVGTSSHSRAWGAGVAAPITVGSSNAPMRASVSPGFDVAKQEDGGPAQESVTLDVTVQPGGSSSITPYVGVSASANWSGGSNKQWEGTRLGLETLGGVQVKAGGPLAVKAEERFGYVDGQEHTLTTRLGVLVKL